MEHLIGIICGLIIGAAGTFAIGIMVYVLVNASSQTSKYTLFKEIAARLEMGEETPEETPEETTKPKPKNGRRKPRPHKRKPRKPNANA